MALTAKKVYAILKRQISDMEAKLNSPVRYRGTVATADLLPLNPDIGDMYNIESKSVYGEAGMNVAWNGVVWDTMGAPIDMSLYFTKEEAEAVIQRLVTEYFEKNPVKPGATTEQAQQIEQNKADIASLKTETDSLKEDISNKITKFYASSQGETHLADSDNGKIMDMMVYGKSEQKQYSGKNLLNVTLQTTTVNGVTCTNNGDGTYTLDGTANANAVFNLGSVTFTGDTKYKICGCPQGGGIIERYHIEPYGSTNEQRDIGNGVIYSLSNDETKAIYIVVIIGFRASNLLFKPMITTDLTATYDNFEPYTGGIPSPSPDYPQEIKSVVNPTVKVCGKNLLELPISNKSTQAGITFEVANDSVIKITGINDGSRVSQYIAYNSQDVKYAKLIPYKNIAITISTYNDDVIAGLAYWLKSENYATVHYKQNKRKCTIDLGEDAKIVPWFFIPKNGAYTNDTVKFGVYYGTDELTYNAPKCHTVTLPYTLNAIPVSSGGNVTIDGQQYIADYVERGKRIRRIIKYKITGDESIYEHASGWLYCETNLKLISQICATSIAKPTTNQNILSGNYIRSGATGFYFTHNDMFTDVNAFKNYVKNNDVYVYAALSTPEEIDLTPEEIAAFKALATYYPTTNISVNSEQLDGYTVFNYPISLADGWNYVKQQINDNRDYIYNMDARTQDTDLQAAEAYVNSEYAVALTELEV